MKKVPTMISTKDMMYISDMFNWHLVAAKKMESFAPCIEDEECADKLNTLSKMHYEACDSLIKLLGGASK